MKICFMCDLHLPFEKQALQYRVLEWAIGEINKQQPGCIICAGDITCDGNIQTYTSFIDQMNGLNIPFIFIPGNSDLRNAESKDVIMKHASPCRNIIEEIEIIALNDCDGTLDEKYYSVYSDPLALRLVFQAKKAVLVSVNNTNGKPLFVFL